MTHTITFRFCLLVLLLIPSGFVSASDLSGRYFMDGNPNRVIMIKYIGDDLYRVEEPGSPWPWSGAAIFEGNKIQGLVRLSKSGNATMMLNGSVRSDGSIVIDYVFMTDNTGNLMKKIGPDRGRVDNHIWYRAK
ncbi:MAG: hypothetical protein HKM93_09215 [Desulfobacteraceae bacterium]|nr:hypothetical protein [Desulfobacteraceae bacterium]